MGLEPTLRKELDPKSDMSTHSTTGAYLWANIKSAAFILLLLLCSNLILNYLRMATEPTGIEPASQKYPIIVHQVRLELTPLFEIDV